MNKKAYKLSTVLAVIAAFSVFTWGDLGSQDRSTSYIDLPIKGAYTDSERFYSRSRATTHADVAIRGLKSIVIEDFETSQVTTDLNTDGWFVRTNPAPFNSNETEQKLRQKKSCSGT